MAQLDTVNRLSCPEFTGHTTSNGITSYAIREPGHVLWRGTAANTHKAVRSRSVHVEPADAIAEAVDALTGVWRIIEGGKGTRS